VRIVFAPGTHIDTKGEKVSRFLLMASETEREPAGSIIRSARKRRGWSQEKLAETLGTSRTQVIRWEGGRGYPGDAYRTKLAVVLDIDPVLLRRVEPTPNELRSLEDRLRDLETKLAELQSRLHIV